MYYIVVDKNPFFLENEGRIQHDILYGKWHCNHAGSSVFVANDNAKNKNYIISEENLIIKYPFQNIYESEPRPTRGLCSNFISLKPCRVALHINFPFRV